MGSKAKNYLKIIRLPSVFLVVFLSLWMVLRLLGMDALAEFTSFLGTQWKVLWSVQEWQWGAFLVPLLLFFVGAIFILVRPARVRARVLHPEAKWFYGGTPRKARAGEAVVRYFGIFLLLFALGNAALTFAHPVIETRIKEPIAHIPAVIAVVDVSGSECMRFLGSLNFQRELIAEAKRRQMNDPDGKPVVLIGVKYFSGRPLTEVLPTTAYDPLWGIMERFTPGCSVKADTGDTINLPRGLDAGGATEPAPSLWGAIRDFVSFEDPELADELDRMWERGALTIVSGDVSPTKPIESYLAAPTLRRIKDAFRGKLIVFTTDVEFNLYSESISTRRVFEAAASFGIPIDLANTISLSADTPQIYSNVYSSYKETRKEIKDLVARTGGITYFPDRPLQEVTREAAAMAIERAVQNAPPPQYREETITDESPQTALWTIVFAAVIFWIAFRLSHPIVGW